MRNRFVSGTASVVSNVTAPVSRSTTKLRTGLLRTLRKVSRKYTARAYGFLAKVQRTGLRTKTASALLQAAAILDRRSLHYRELKFYHNRPSLRLPELAVTRNRKRKAGLVTFTKNSLPNATNLLAQSLSLLPPASAYTSAKVRRTPALAPAPATLLSYRRRTDLLPIF